VAGGDWHSGCVRCRECACSLNVKSAVALQGDVYCKVHIPKPKATTVADDVMSQHAKAAQATKTHSREATGASGAIHSDMRKGDGAEVHAAHGVAKAQAAASPASYEEEPQQQQEAYGEPEPEPEHLPNPIDFEEPDEKRTYYGRPALDDAKPATDPEYCPSCDRDADPESEPNRN